METFSALLALCAGGGGGGGGIHRSPMNSPHRCQWRRALMFFFDLLLNKRLCKQSWGWWFETPLRSLWRHCNENVKFSRSVPPRVIQHSVRHSNNLFSNAEDILCEICIFKKNKKLCALYPVQSGDDLLEKKALARQWIFNSFVALWTYTYIS